MQINQEQIEAIRKLVRAAEELDPGSETFTCEEEHGEDKEECGAKYTVDNVITDDGELTTLRHAAEQVSRILDCAPTLPSEIEIAALQDKLTALIRAEQCVD